MAHLDYDTRIIDTELDDLFSGAAAIAIEGAKGVGKTATARRRVKTVLELDDPIQYELVSGDPFGAIKRREPLLIDEWQRVPAVWDAVRRAVDDDNSPSRFLLTGSASPGPHTTHSGAGRILRVRMRPLSLAERKADTPSVSVTALLAGASTELEGETQIGLAEYAHEIVASGFPAIRGLPQRARVSTLDGYIEQIVDRDVIEAGFTPKRSAQLVRWLRAYGAATSTVASYETIRDAATGEFSEKPARASGERYRDVLERMWVLEPIPAWLPTQNRITALTQLSKHQLVDPALAARLMSVDAQSLLHGTGAAAQPGPGRTGSVFGALFESLVTQSVRVYAQAARARVHHLRTERGRREVDLIVVGPDQRVLAIEVKLGGVIDDKDVANLRWLRDMLGDTCADAIVVTTGRYAYRRQDGIGVVPASLLGP
jgi:uncharacterized protein